MAESSCRAGRGCAIAGAGTAALQRGAGLEFRFGDQAIAINMADTDSLLQELGTRLASGRGFALATLNLDHLVKLSASGRSATPMRATT
jgi:hypothetical protein